MLLLGRALTGVGLMRRFFLR
ncbi:MAG: hypothetical protein DME49_01750 [Verrucomicrobia bacterium]|nr:MAG: hypothetical protein DME49_01750 [Verrucomicrobiota bacterium]PYL38453.1 MAG: hypothetical protein DMF34_06865 [Verrucomicrobiota bacterium]PYL59119.1 MAG: hypothetical protein DMF30_00450 [Verrucomicrobiota bacterium]